MPHGIGLLLFLGLLVAPASSRADETVTVAPVLAPGDVFDVVVTRERSVDNDGHWLLEAKSHTFARLRVLARGPDGLRLSWSVARIVHDLAPGEPSDVAKKLGSIAEGLAFEVEADARGRPRAIRERGRVREWLHAATDRVVDDIERGLVGGGYPEAQVDAVGEAMRRPFHELADAPDERFDGVWLRDLLTLLDLAGRELPVGEELHREATGPVPMIGDREPRLSIREQARFEERDGARRLVVERSETPAEEIAPREVLARFPGLLAMIARMEPARQQQALDELPPVTFGRDTVWTLDADTFLPVRVELGETLAIGGLGRRTRAVYEIGRAEP